MKHHIIKFLGGFTFDDLMEVREQATHNADDFWRDTIQELNGKIDRRDGSISQMQGMVTELQKRIHELSGEKKVEKKARRKRVVKKK